MNSLKEELDIIKKLLYENNENYKKEIFVFSYGEELNLDLVWDNMTIAEDKGDKTFTKVMDIAIEKYNSCEVVVDLGATTCQNITIRGNFTNNITNIIDSISILLNNIGCPTKKQILFVHINDKINFVSVCIIGLIDYCECKYHYSWEHLWNKR